MQWLIFLAALPSSLIASIAAVLVRNRAETWGLVAVPRHDRFSRHATPTGGGLAIWLGVVTTLAAVEGIAALASHDLVPATLFPDFMAPHFAGIIASSHRLWTFLLAATVMLVLGLIDDRSGVDWRLRLAVQTLVASIMVWQGWRLTLFIDQPLVTYPLSVLWIVGLVNSFNMLDNMDGLASGVAAIASILLAIVMLAGPHAEPSGPQLFVAGLLVVLAGSLGGFWIHNSPPATIYMGDAGSYFVGFTVAVATLMATFAGEDLPRHALFAPLCVLAVPIYDTSSVVLIRLRQCRSPFVGDKNHFSHRLVQLGLTPKQAVWTIYLLTAACGMASLLLHQVNWIGAIILVTMIICVLLTIAILEMAAARK